MQNKRNVFISIFQIVIGILAIIGFIAALLLEESMIKWTVTLILGITLIVFGTINMILFYKNKN